MATEYTRSQLELMVLNQVNAIKGAETAFDETHSEMAFDEAVRDCGFDMPSVDDADRFKKYQWLIERMRYWFLRRLWEQYALRFDAGDLKAQQVAVNLEKLCTKMNEQFIAAKQADETAHLFADAETVFGTSAVVVSTGIVEDRIGQSVEERQ